MVQVYEVLRHWLGGKGHRRAAEAVGADRKTARRYVEAALAAGVVRELGEAQLTDDLIAEVMGRVQPGSPGGHGAAWQACEAQRKFLETKLADDLRLTKVHELLERQLGHQVPYRTLHRFARQELGFRQPAATVRVDDGEPGAELQVDFGKLGMMSDPADGRRRAVWGLVFTACYSRLVFVWLTFRQELESVIAGFEAAWEFFGGVFRVVIPDNLKPVIDEAHPLAPRLNDGFLLYVRARGFEVDAARVRSPQDKPRVERMVQFVRESFFAGEEFHGLVDAQERAEKWCRRVAERVHGTTRRRPAEVFTAEEQPRLLPAPAQAYDIPLLATAKVQRDRHISVCYALYSVPEAYLGERVDVHADRALVRISFRGKLLRTHPRMPPGGRSTHDDDVPAHQRIYATRDEASLRKLAVDAGEQVGRFAELLLSGPHPWRRMRQCYRLGGLVRRYGAARVDEACGRALGHDVVDVMRVERMLEQAVEASTSAESEATGQIATPRFARPAEHFSVNRGGRHE